MTTKIDLFEKEMLALRAQREIDKKDAERYRFLRAKALNISDSLEGFITLMHIDYINDSNGIDAEIDKAMAE